jgi:AraC-like DNA-binding protein
MSHSEIAFTPERPAASGRGAARRELAAIIARCAPGDGSFATAIPSLTVHRSTRCTEPTHTVYSPALTLLAQGAKRVLLGDEVFEYDDANYLVTSVDLPVTSRVTLASPDTPYLCVAWSIDPHAAAALIAEAELRAPSATRPERAMGVSAIEPVLMDAVLRLARLLDTPRDIAILAPVIEREILYRLLTGAQAARLWQIAAAESQSQQIARAIDWLKANFSGPLRIETLAQAVHMSASSLHHHFKAITGLSPLQYQKQLRLREARRLMMTDDVDAAAAARRVGYESASQFSREYHRLFGAPPVRDVTRLRLVER